MQYIAVFNLFSIPVAKGFASLKETVDYLDQIDTDPDSAPLGIYDVAAADIIAYQTDKYFIEDQDKRLVLLIAQSYMERAC